MEELRKQILLYLEKHSRVDLGELAVLLGTDEVTVANEISAMERAKIICGYHTLIDWDKTGTEYVNALIEVKVTPLLLRSGHSHTLFLSYPSRSVYDSHR